MKRACLKAVFSLKWLRVKGVALLKTRICTKAVPTTNFFNSGLPGSSVLRFGFFGFFGFCLGFLNVFKIGCLDFWVWVLGFPGDLFLQFVFGVSLWLCCHTGLVGLYSGEGKVEKQGWVVYIVERGR